MNEQQTEKIRLDKWLWAARFFKTRQLANAAISGGKVHYNGQRVKPSREVHPGALLQIQKGALSWEIEVLTLSKQRGPASEATKLYQESEASFLKRQQLVAEQREQRSVHRNPALKGRPSKKDRRQLDRFRDGF